MSNIDKGRLDRPRDQGVISGKIEADKKEKVPFVGLPEGKSQRMLAATFINTLKRLFDAFSSSDESSLADKIISKQTVLETLYSFKNLLTRLHRENLSQDAPYTSELSEHWRKILDDYQALQTMERKGSMKVALFRQTTDLISHYPPGADHSFGYYLLEQAGKDWLPFPFIEMLSQLHADYKNNGETSILSQWARQLDKLIAELRGKIPTS